MPSRRDLPAPNDNAQIRQQIDLLAQQLSHLQVQLNAIADQIFTDDDVCFDGDVVDDDEGYFSLPVYDDDPSDLDAEDREYLSLSVYDETPSDLDIEDDGYFTLPVYDEDPSDRDIEDDGYSSLPVYYEDSSDFDVNDVVYSSPPLYDEDFLVLMIQPQLLGDFDPTFEVHRVKFGMFVQFALFDTKFGMSHDVVAIKVILTLCFLLESKICDDVVPMDVPPKPPPPHIAR